MGTFLTKGTTFTTGDTVTAGSLNNLVDNATVTAGSISSTELGADSVINGKIIDSATGSEPVTTGTVRDNAISNAKLAQMASQTVKVNKTMGAADPAEVEVAANKLLVGTSDSLKAVTFATDLVLDAADDAATKISISKEAINSQGTDLTTLDADNDRLLIYDATASGSLAKTSPKRIVQSQAASTTASGACALATSAELIDPSGADANDVISAATGAPMLAKAWVEFTSTGSDVAQTITNSFNITSLTRNGEGVYDILFATDLPSDKYILFSNGITSSTASGIYLMGRITSRTATGVGCTVKFAEMNDWDDYRDPDVVATLVFYGLTS